MKFHRAFNRISNSYKDFKIGKMITFDTESKRYQYDGYEKQVFYCGDFFDGTTHYYTENANEILEIIRTLIQKYKYITIFAHNIAYDLKTSMLYKKIMKRYLGDILANIIKPIVFIKIENPYGIIQFIDSYNYFHTKLSTLAEMFNLQKVADEEYKYDAEEWNKYLEQRAEILVKTDTLILYEVLSAFFKMPFNFGISIAQTSFNTWKAKYLKKEIVYSHGFDNMIDDLYRGALVFPYILAKGVYLYSYDINSLYPYVMYSFPSSIRYAGLCDYPDSDEYNYILNVNFGGYGRNPVPIKVDGSLIYFNKYDNAIITGNEYKYLIENNYKVHINKCYKFFNDFIFKDYVKDFYELKSKNTGYVREFYKIMLNSVYGKTGQRKAITEVKSLDDLEEPIRTMVLENIDKDKVIIDDIVYSIYDGFVSIMEKQEPKFNPIIASEITANARLVNFEYQKKLGFEHVYYTDTDSFFIDYKIVSSSLIGDRLGQLKNDKSGVFYINAPKDYFWYEPQSALNYLFGDEFGHTTLKGISSDAIAISENEYLNPTFEGLKSKNNECVIVNYVKKKLNRFNYKLKYINNIGENWNDLDEYNAFIKGDLMIQTQIR